MKHAFSNSSNTPTNNHNNTNSNQSQGEQGNINLTVKIQVNELYTIVNKWVAPLHALRFLRVKNTSEHLTTSEVVEVTLNAQIERNASHLLHGNHLDREREHRCSW